MSTLTPQSIKHDTLPQARGSCLAWYKDQARVHVSVDSDLI